MKHFLFYVLLLTTNPLLAQHQVLRQTDSLRGLLVVEKHDTGRVQMTRISEAYRGAKPDSAMLYGQHALILARRTNFVKGEVNALLALSVLHREMGNLPTALDLALKSLRIAESNHLAYEQRFA